ncbi:MAG: hypothetical protein M3Z97_14315 [Candidatus Dormibacteraeota bacterium]|nr:hypothetical protein [Candidatus Dormibacteraeota bacterium]
MTIPWHVHLAPLGYAGVLTFIAYLAGGFRRAPARVEGRRSAPPGRSG